MPCVERIIHCAGSVAPLPHIAASTGFAKAAQKALANPKTVILCDSKMVAAGITLSANSGDTNSGRTNSRGTISGDANSGSANSGSANSGVGSSIANRKPPKTLCLIKDPRVQGRATKLGITRSRTAVHFWRPYLPHSIVVIGNAPTALEELLDLLAEPSSPKPAAILAFCCGFVGAAAAKRRLISTAPVPYLTLRGNGGGSAMAAAAVNALWSKNSG